MERETTEHGKVKCFPETFLQSKCSHQASTCTQQFCLILTHKEMTLMHMHQEMFVYTVYTYIHLHYILKIYLSKPKKNIVDLVTSAKNLKTEQIALS